MAKPAQVPRRKTRSLEVSVTILCRLHHRLQSRNFGLIELRKRKQLRETMGRLIKRVDLEYYDLRKMLEAGEANPQRVRAALKALEIMIREDVGLLKYQRTYLLCALKRSSEPKSLDQAFGLDREKRGKQPVPTERQTEIAVAVLRMMLKGENLESAAHHVGAKFDLGTTQVREHWAKNKLGAVLTLRLERPPGIYPWKKEEAKRLNRLFAKEKRAWSEFFEQ
jgi:hypothetical protein